MSVLKNCWAMHGVGVGVGLGRGLPSPPPSPPTSPPPGLPKTTKLPAKGPGLR